MTEGTSTTQSSLTTTSHLSEGKEFFTPAEVAARYKNTITTRTLANWRSSGNGPVFSKIGGRILYPVKDLLEWERRRTVQSTNKYQK